MTLAVSLFGVPPSPSIAKAAALAAKHRSSLKLAASLTSDPMLLNQIRAVGARVDRLERFSDAGMLGRNGIGPRVESILASARRAA